MKDKLEDEKKLLRRAVDDLRQRLIVDSSGVHSNEHNEGRSSVANDSVTHHLAAPNQQLTKEWTSGCFNGLATRERYTGHNVRLRKRTTKCQVDVHFIV